MLQASRCHPDRPPSRRNNDNRRLSKSRWSRRAEDLLGAGLGDAVRERELEVLGQELLDVRALDVVGLLELDNAEDLGQCQFRSSAARRNALVPVREWT